MLLSTKLRARQAIAEAAAKNKTLILGGSWNYVGSFFALFSHFFRIFGASYVIMAFLVAFFGFFMDFRWILGGFWEGFGLIFRRFFGFVLKMPIL